MGRGHPCSSLRGWATFTVTFRTRESGGCLRRAGKGARSGGDPPAPLDRRWRSSWNSWLHAARVGALALAPGGCHPGTRAVAWGRLRSSPPRPPSRRAPSGQRPGWCAAERHACRPSRCQGLTLHWRPPPTCSQTRARRALSCSGVYATACRAHPGTCAQGLGGETGHRAAHLHDLSFLGWGAGSWTPARPERSWLGGNKNPSGPAGRASQPGYV